jgi:predicted solute-binding protein
MTPILTRAMLTNALDALGVESNGTVASVKLAPGRNETACSACGLTHAGECF